MGRPAGLYGAERPSLRTCCTSLFFPLLHLHAIRDVSGTHIFQSYLNLIQSIRVFIRPYPIPSIQYLYPIRIRMLKSYIFMMSIFITILSDKN